MNFKFSKTWRVVKEIATTLGLTAVYLIGTTLLSLVMGALSIAYLMPWIIAYGIIKLILGDSTAEVGVSLVEISISIAKFLMVVFSIFTGLMVIFHTMSESVKNIRSILKASIQ